MALKKPAFEQEPTINAEAVPASAYSEAATATVDEAPQYDESPRASAAASVAVAKASATSLSVADAANKAKEFQREVAAMKGASDFAYGNYPVFKGNNGSIAESGGEESDLGRWAQVRLLSWDEHFECSPGETGASTKDFVAYSKDGKTIDSVIGEEQKRWVGASVNDYMNYLKNEEEFSNAKCRRFIDTACALMATDSGDGPIGTVIQVTLSESSIPAFSKYQQSLSDTARCVSMGLPGFKLPDDPFTFFFLREVAAKGNNRWTKLKIVSSLPAKL